MALHYDIIPYLKPAEMLAWMAKNPFLLATYPELCAQRAADLAAGALSPARTQAIASGMTQERLRLRLKQAHAHPALNEQADWQRVEELLQATEIEARERMEVRAFGRKAHATEWPWLIARMEEVITRRAVAKEGYPEEADHLAAAA